MIPRDWCRLDPGQADSHRKGGDPQRGGVLVFVVFLILALMGFVGLVVDLGIVRAGQSSMQLGADLAALEGVRFRDVDPSSPMASDAARRDLAALAALRVFDEDLDPGTLPVDLLLGAGPTLSTGVEGIDSPAGGVLEAGAPFVPALQSNASANLRFGDLVAGTYTALDPLDAGSSSWHAESFDYARTDFAPSAPASSPDARALLARVRRTNDPDGLDEVPGVSSRGPTLPYLFALGSGVLSTPDPEVYDPRRDGITVRATAIGDARPALSVGLRSPAAVGRPVPGLLELGQNAVDPVLLRVLALEDEPWTTGVPVGAEVVLLVGEDGSVEADPAGPSPGLDGRAQNLVDLVRVGEVATSDAFPTSLALVTPTFVPGERIFVPLVSALDVIVGFGQLELDSYATGVDGSGRPQLVVRGRKVASTVASQNASAVPSLSADPGALAEDVPGRALLLAPVLAR